tara:strand:+ start:290 stop:745 length:456 start_codon:yes stop_codon:yes gene_type:complete
MHASALVGAARDTFLIHGGRGGDEGELTLSDAHLLCLRTLRWSTLGETEWARFGHAIAQPLNLGLPEMIFFGGVHETKLCRDAWRLRVPPEAGGLAALPRLEHLRSSDAPSRRFAHAAAALGQSVFIFGGSDKVDELGDLHEGEFVEERAC